MYRFIKLVPIGSAVLLTAKLLLLPRKRGCPKPAPQTGAPQTGVRLKPARRRPALHKRVPRKRGRHRLANRVSRK